jgi:K+-sensing histidine kinase KdpD
MMAESSSKPSTADPAVAWSDVVRFVRQVSHDLRNHLNAAELQSVYLNEIATDAEMKAELKRLRAMISELGAVLQKLSAGLTPPKPNLMSYKAVEFMEDIQQKFENDFPDRKAQMEWQVEAGEAKIEIDPQLLQQAMLELFDNAFRHREGDAVFEVAAKIEGDRFVVKLSEPKKEFALATTNWGREPLGRVGQGHYGLGLNWVRAILEAQGGTFRADYDSATLITTIGLPVANTAN